VLTHNTMARRALLVIVPCALLGFGAGYAFGGDRATDQTPTFKAVKLEASKSRPAIDAPGKASSLPALIPPPAVDSGGGNTSNKPVDNTVGNPPPPPPPPGEEF
jgi:hypothetical protein